MGLRVQDFGFGFLGFGLLVMFVAAFRSRLGLFCPVSGRNFCCNCEAHAAAAAAGGCGSGADYDDDDDGDDDDDDDHHRHHASL